jgi:hypothetical protein
MASKIKVDQIQTADGTGTIALQNQLSGLTSASMPTGSVLQVIQDTNGSIQTTTSQTYVDTNLSVTITPNSTSSKIFLQYSFRGINMGVNAGFGIRFVRDSTPLFTTGSSHDGLEQYNYNTAVFTSDSNFVLDSPNTTSAITYKVQVRAYSSSAQVTLTTGSDFRDTLIAMEIAG